MVSELALFIPGPPRGWARPRFRARDGGGLHSYTDPGVRGYLDRIQQEWIARGRPTIPPGPYEIEVLAFMARPQAHLRAGGELSAQGKRATYPVRKPDLDNVAKAIIEALMECGATPDDSRLCSLTAVKRWVVPGIGEEREGVHVMVRSLLTPDELTAAGVLS
jgi:Holliday junction resolvase RusA-like endonuclease